MTKGKKIILGLVIGTIALYGLNVYRAWKRGPLNDYISTIYVDTFDNLTKRKTTVFETKGTISGIEISVDGKIQGTGTLTIAYNDTTIYKEYKLDSGTVDINHKSDWYADKCEVTFIPTNSIKGKLEISCDFIGD
jgi:hypothetical protein